MLSARPSRVGSHIRRPWVPGLFLVVFISTLLGPPILVLPSEAGNKGTLLKETKVSHNVVIVYITSWCPACKMTMDYLREKKIPFVAKDIEKNEAYMREMVEKVGAYRGVPVLDINGRIFLGFNPYVLDELTK